MRAGPADLATWFSLNGMSQSRFLLVGIVYCAVAVTGIAAAGVLRRNYARDRLLAIVFVALVALDMLGDFYRKRSTGFDWEDVVETVLSAIPLLVTAIYLVQSRRRLETDAT
jgi:hypothetical protein